MVYGILIVKILCFKRMTAIFLRATEVPRQNWFSEDHILYHISMMELFEQ